MPIGNQSDGLKHPKQVTS